MKYDYKIKNDFEIVYNNLNQNMAKLSDFFKITKTTAYKYAKRFGLKKDSKINTGIRHSVNKNYFKKIDSEEKAYWLGFLMADGCIYKGSDQYSYRLQINLSIKDIDILERFKLDIESTHPIVEKSVFNKTTGKEYKTVTLKINSTDLCRDLIINGIVENKTYSCAVPNIKKSLIRHFIRGFFDGDGCLSLLKNNKAHFSIVGCADILNDFHKIFKENNILTRIYDINHSSAKSIETSSKKEIQKIYKFLYNNSKISLKRKKDKFEKII